MQELLNVSKTEKGIKMKDVKILYKNISVGVNGETEYCGKQSVIFKVTPLNIIQKSDELKTQIYDSYYPFVKGMPNEFKIIVCKGNSETNKNIQKLRKRAMNVKSIQLQNAILTYALNLESITKENESNIKNYYLVVPRDEVCKIKFEILKEIGLDIVKIENKDEIEEILKKGINVC